MSEKILDRVKKLLAKAESAKEIGSLAEAEAFMQKVNELMIEYNLSMHDIRMAAAADNDKFADWIYGEYVEYKENLAGGRWRMDLIKMICRHTLTGIVFNTHIKKFRVYGQIENVESTVWQYNFLSSRLLSMAKDARKESAEALEHCRHTFLKDYLMGSIHGIERKLIEQAKESKLKDAVNQLIKYNDKALDEYVKEKVGDVIKSMPRGNQTLASGAYKKGYNDGKSMSMGNRLSASEQAVQKKLLGS